MAREKAREQQEQQQEGRQQPEEDGQALTRSELRARAAFDRRDVDLVVGASRGTLRVSPQQLRAYEIRAKWTGAGSAIAAAAGNPEGEDRADEVLDRQGAWVADPYSGSYTWLDARDPGERVGRPVPNPAVPEHRDGGGWVVTFSDGGVLTAVWQAHG